METGYIPGVCNIGPEEIRVRLWAGWTGVIITLLLGALLYGIGASPWMRVVVFIPAFVGAMGFLQGWMHFCVAFGSKGVFNMNRAVGITQNVEKAEFRKKDQRKVILIWTYAFLTGLVVALVSFFL